MESPTHWSTIQESPWTLTIPVVSAIITLIFYIRDYLTINTHREKEILF